MDKICFGIVTYNPDISLLKRSVDKILHQSNANAIVIVDNFSSNIIEIVNEVHVEIIRNKENGGIGKALNQIMEWAIEKQFDWVVTLDQDSLLPEDYLFKVKKHINELDAGILCPVIVDRDIGTIEYIGVNSFSEIDYLDECITSGACTKVSAWKKAGKYDESMFIDSVDFEFCYRVRKNGYKILRVNELMLEHKIGNGQLKKFIVKKVWVKNHSAFRKYYIVRNMIYLCRKHKLWKKLFRSILRFLYLIILTVLYEDDKARKIYALFKGLKDGFLMPINEEGMYV